MRWLEYVLGLAVGTTFGFWFHDTWEGDLTGTGAPSPPNFDLYLPLGLFALSTVYLVVRARRR